MDSEGQAEGGRPASSPGSTFWITGLPGCGKSTLAQALALRLRAIGRSVVRLDGDRLRPILGERYSFARSDRRAMARLYGRLCRELSGQGHDVVCATVSMFHDVHAWNRLNLPGYREIYIKVSVETLIARHPRGLQAAARAGRVRNVPGVDLAVDEPLHPDVLVEDDGERSAAEISDTVFATLWPAEPR